MVIFPGFGLRPRPQGVRPAATTTSARVVLLQCKLMGPGKLTLLPSTSPEGIKTQLLWNCSNVPFVASCEVWIVKFTFLRHAQ